MFNMIATIVAIALVVVLTATAVYYGGTITGDQTTKASAAQFRNEASQIAGAVSLFKAQGNSITSEFNLADLVDQNYLKTLPEGWEPGQNAIVRRLDPNDPASESICLEANNQASFTFTPGDEFVVTYSQDSTKGLPGCDMPNLPGAVPCCIE